MAKTLTIEQVKDCDTALKYGLQHGMEDAGCHGGHRKLTSPKGSMVVSTHDHNPSKGLVHAMKKQLLRLCMWCLGLSLSLYTLYLFLPYGAQVLVEDAFFKIVPIAYQDKCDPKGRIYFAYEYLATRMRVAINSLSYPQDKCHIEHMTNDFVKALDSFGDMLYNWFISKQ